MLISGFLFMVGLAMLTAGAEAMIGGAVAIARKLQISTLVIGLTIVALGTSLPELVVSLHAALTGRPEITIGNVVGSNIANILLILGVAAILSPVICTREILLRDGMTLLAATILLVLAAWLGPLFWLHGILALMLLGGYLLAIYFNDRRRGENVHSRDAESVQPLSNSMWKSVMAVLIGLGLMVWGGDVLVTNAVIIARQLGISDAVIGLTIVALGTSFPELAATIVAAYRKHADVALGNIIGSCLFNILGILGTVTLFIPLHVPAQILRIDFPIMLGCTVLLLIMMRSHKRVSWAEGCVLLCAYVGYISYLLYQTQVN